MEIILNTYNLKDIKNTVIKHCIDNNCIDNNPTLNIDEIAKKLGCSERTIQRGGFVINRKKQCNEGRHRPKYDSVSGLSCSKCGISLIK